jgi:hypothetical protein
VGVRLCPRFARNGLKRIRGWCADCDRDRVARVRLSRCQAGLHVLVHNEEFLFGISRAGHVVVWQHHELGDQPSPIRYSRQLHELNTIDHSAERRRQGVVSGVRHGYCGEFRSRVRHLHNQAATPSCESDSLAEP